MAPIRRIIIDTDPGVDDILAILLALSAKPEEVEVLLLSLTFGNVEVHQCLRNAVSMFHVLEKELAWRKARGQPEGFDSMKTFKPIIAVGADEPLDDQLMMADYFHGADGLGGVHTSHPHFTPDDSWNALFNPPPAASTHQTLAEANQLASTGNFIPSHQPAHKEMLRILRENEVDTITIIGIGPLTNLALAAAEDPETFLRVKEVVVMGGTIEEEGNITPVAEFNIYADSIASARVYALTSPTPSSTLPPSPPPSTFSPPKAKSLLQSYPNSLPRQLNLTMFPLDITMRHILDQGDWDATVESLIKEGSPLAEWANVFMASTFKVMEERHVVAGRESRPKDVGIALHDPLTIWYILTGSSPSWAPRSPEDIRIETCGQWTRGMCVVDKRNRNFADDGEQVAGDIHGWLDRRKGNRVRRMVGSPGDQAFSGYLLERIFGRPNA